MAFRIRTVLCLASFVSALAFAGSAVAQPVAGFAFSDWGAVVPESYRFHAADFNGDKLDDLQLSNGYEGWFRVVTNSGTSLPAPHVLSQVGSDDLAGWLVKTGNFNGDGLADVLAYKGNLAPSIEDGALLIGLNLGGAFQWSRWATLSPTSGWSFVVGDFSGDGRDDVLAYLPSSGQLWVGTNSGTDLTFSLWATVYPASGWIFDAGRFTNDGLEDVVGYHPSNSSVWVGESDGATFTFSAWGSFSPSGDNLVQLMAGEFNGAGKADIVGYDDATGELTVGLNTGANFLMRKRGNVYPAEGWDFAAGSFAGLPQQDLVAYRYYSDPARLWVGDNLTPQCANEIDDDGNGKIDFGAGAENDPNCASATDVTEKRPPGCGLGTELVAILPALALWRARRRPPGGMPPGEAVI